MLAFAVSAQEDGGKKFVISGTLGINHTGHSYQYDGANWINDNGATTSFDLTIMPKFGYQVNENLLIGAGLGYYYSSNKVFASEADIHPAATTTLTSSDNDKLGATRNNADNMFMIGLFGRYNLAKFGQFTMFGELQLALGFGGRSTVTTIENPVGAEVAETTNADISLFAMGATIVPGLNYAVNDNLSIDLYFNLIGLTYSVNKETDHQAAGAGTAAAPYIEDVTTTHTFGLNCDLQNNTINGYLGGITVGINYHF